MKKTIPENIKPKHFVVYDDIFKQQVDVFINYNADMYTRWLNKNKIKDIDLKCFDNFAGWVSGYDDEDGKTKFILFMPVFQWAIKHQATLIHEITHAVIKIWQKNNIPFTPDNQEFLAHSIGNMYDDIAHKLLVPVTNKRRSKKAN